MTAPPLEVVCEHSFSVSYYREDILAKVYIVNERSHLHEVICLVGYTE